jgi:hypothetical protein
MHPSANGKAGYLEGIVDSHDLRAVILEALGVLHVDDEALRRGVWTYVGAERHKGTSPGHVIMALTEIVDMANLQPLSARQAITRRVILWCVEAYFGHLGGDVVGREPEALSDAPVSPVHVENRYE